MGRKSSARHWQLGAELKKRREAAGVSGTQVAKFTGWSSTKLSRVENGLQKFSRVDVIHYMGALGVYGTYNADLRAMCPHDEDNQGYWLSPEGDWLPSSLNSLIFFESMATDLVLYDPMVVNGLLQTADYARTLISCERWRDAENIERIVQVRMERKQILDRPAAAGFTFFLHEQALRNSVGSSKVMHDQLLFLVLVAALRNVTLRVVPSERAEQGALGGPFRVMSYYQHRPLVYLDQLESGLFLEEEEFVAPYRDRQVSLLADLAWDAGQSREFVASLATEFDRGSRKRHAGIYELEEEQL